MEHKDKNHDALLTLREKIGGCFGSANGVFATHTLDEQRAKEFGEIAKDNDITLREIQDIALGYLYRNNYPAEHIKEQTDLFTNFFKSKVSY